MFTHIVLAKGFDDKDKAIKINMNTNEWEYSKNIDDTFHPQSSPMTVQVLAAELGVKVPGNEAILNKCITQQKIHYLYKANGVLRLGPATDTAASTPSPSEDAGRWSSGNISRASSDVSAVSGTSRVRVYKKKSKKRKSRASSKKRKSRVSKKKHVSKKRKSRVSKKKRVSKKRKSRRRKR